MSKISREYNSVYASSILTLFLIAQGLPASALLWREISGDHSYRVILALILLPLLLGLTQDLILVLTFRNLQISVYAGILIAVCGSPLCLWRREDLKRIMIVFSGHMRLQRFSMAASVLVALIVLVYLLGNLYNNPIADWDARSIWFFHAKILFFDGGFKETSWTLPTISFFSHPDYPQAVPILASQIAYLNGYWNEYDPLTSIAVLLVIEVMLSVYVLKTPAELILFWGLVGVFLSKTPFRDGLMDAHVATLSALAAMCLLRRGTVTAMADCCLGVLTLGLVASLKNEGLVLSLLLLAACFLANSYFREALLTSRRSIFILAMAVLPTFLWFNLKRQWGLANDLSTHGQLKRLMARINLHDVVMILGSTKVLLALFGMGILFLANRLTSKNSAAANTLILCAALYYGVLFAVYMTTPYDLQGHLETSANRVVYPIYVMLICAIVLYFRSWRLLSLLVRRWSEPETKLGR